MMDTNADIKTATLAVIDELMKLTSTDRLKWENVPKLYQDKLKYADVEYVLDFAGREQLLFIDGVLVCRGYELDKLRHIIHDKARLAVDIPTPEPSDYRAPRALQKALQSLA